MGKVAQSCARATVQLDKGSIENLETPRSEIQMKSIVANSGAPNASLILVLPIAILFLSAEISAAPTQGQTLTVASVPTIQILRYQWSKERIDWERDPFSGTLEGFHDTRHRLRRERNVASVLQQRSDRAEQAAKESPPAPPRYAFNYKLLVHNTGEKVIKEIDWDYIFTDAVTGEVLGRREFTSVEKIDPGKRKELSILVSSPPIRRISVYALGKRERQGLLEQVAIMRIVYDDNTTWEAR